VLVPYLSEEWLLNLEGKGISGIDLCGNGVIIVPNELLVLRTGFPNLFRWEGTIKNVYRKNRSVGARLFLLVPEFCSVSERLGKIKEKGGRLTLATVSKVCQRLESDLVIEGGRGQAPWIRPQALPRPGEPLRPPKVGPSPFVRWYRLLQPEKLLELLAESYVPPTVTRIFQGKCEWGLPELGQFLQWRTESSRTRVVHTGASSTEAYAVMGREPVQSFYCSDVEGTVQILGN